MKLTSALRSVLGLSLLMACGDDDSPPATPHQDASTPPPDTMRDASISMDAQVDAQVDAQREASAPDAYVSDDGAVSSVLSLKMATYNVAGLPEGISSSNPAVNSALISPLLNDYQLALLQEDFAYHPQIISMAKQPYVAPVDATQGSLGDGLSFLSDYPFSGFERIAWTDCFGVLDSGSDCLTPKGFSFTRFQIAAGVSIDVYDVHADAGSAAGDFDARAKNLRQLAAAINMRSQGNLVIVAGDTNARYSTVGDIVPEFVSTANLHDVWVDQLNGGVQPVAGTPVVCSTTDANDPHCERLDKVFYRNGSNGWTLLPVAYSVDGARFVDQNGAQLSDHRPVSVTFQVLGPQ